MHHFGVCTFFRPDGDDVLSPGEVKVNKVCGRRIASYDFVCVHEKRERERETEGEREEDIS